MSDIPSTPPRPTVPASTNAPRKDRVSIQTHTPTGAARILSFSLHG